MPDFLPVPHRPSEVEAPGLRAILVEEDGSADVITLSPPTHTSLQQRVGGRFDVLRCRPSLDMWINDDGLYECEPNPVASMMALHMLGEIPQIYFGPVVFTGGADEEGETLGLTEAQAAYLTDLAARMARRVDRPRFEALGKRMKAAFR
ncbi:DUF3846 domain-containing protein [Streptomyces megasporus]|uniref:DUF3846 domain-containing protein n=1 Tax=Streptomyces megasporus TaxID=44060 RepID=UPI000691CF4D|nr:DUF3846 domain-containing protein [Streptomyces megasporus]